MQIALYGLGRMGKHHRRHLLALGHSVHVYDPALGFHDVPAGVDAVVVASPTRSHLEVALPWLRRGVPVLVEKPLAATVAEAEILAGYPHCAVAHIERFNNAFQPISTREARFVQAERLAPPADRGVDVDVVLDLMIHDLDLFHALTRSPLREVRANGLSVRSGQVDIVHARVETEGGHVGVFAASRVSRKTTRSFRVFTPEGYWSADLLESTVVRIDPDLSEHHVQLAPQDALAAELTAFLDSISGGPTFRVSGQDGLAALRMAEAVRCACS